MSKTFKQTRECKGCQSYDFEHAGCHAVIPYLYRKHCPCKNCIVKSMCDIGCSTLIEFDDAIYNINKRKYNGL